LVARAALILLAQFVQLSLVRPPASEYALQAARFCSRNAIKNNSQLSSRKRSRARRPPTIHKTVEIKISAAHSYEIPFKFLDQERIFAKPLNRFFILYFVEQAGRGFRSFRVKNEAL
jgi:hypothetical protein